MSLQQKKKKERRDEEINITPLRTEAEKKVSCDILYFIQLIIYIKKKDFVGCDWLREIKFSGNIIQKRGNLVQKRTAFDSGLKTLKTLINQLF